MKRIISIALCTLLLLCNITVQVYAVETSEKTEQRTETLEDLTGTIGDTSETVESTSDTIEGMTDTKEKNGVAGEPGEKTDLGLSAPSAILMEVSTGSIVYEKDADTRLSPASITKIMTLILIFDALESGQIHMEDQVTTSAYAKSMGGSQVFLEEGELQTVETLIKCIVVASGNDASVAMAEYIAGSETEFVRRMNGRAAGLGMSNTNFEDCCGLTDSDIHYSSAHDVGLMSCELLKKYPQITNYSTIWMENITHTTVQGTKEFCLSNTNKLLKQYEWTTGLKTGSTSKAKYCLSASALKDGIQLVAVVMACPNYKERFPEARKLLQYGYGKVRLYEDMPEVCQYMSVEFGKEETVPVRPQKGFSYLTMENEDFSVIRKELRLNDDLTAPVKEGDVVGYMVYFLGEKELGSIEIVAEKTVEEAGFIDCIRKIFIEFLCASTKM